MKLQFLLILVVLTTVLFVPSQGLFGSTSLQDYVESFIDAANFKFDGALNLNDSAIGRIWSFFKSKYGRAYSSVGEFDHFFFLDNQMFHV